jgi:tripartite-type tricarboxylate transporter receptor subunit TctC
MLSRLALLGGGLLATTLAYAQGTQGFPSRNLTVIVPFAPGASADVSRASLAKSWATP